MLRTLVLGLTVALATGQEPSPAPPVAPELLAAAREALAPIAEAMRDVRFVRGRFRQVQESLLLDEPIVTEGRLLLRADPGTVVLEVEGERPVRIRSDATSHLVHHVAARRAERWLFERNEVAAALLACLGADLERLEKAFRPTAVRELPADAERELPRRMLVSLAPRDERLAEFVTELELIVDPRAKRVVEVRHSNPDGERVVLALSNLELDPEEWEEPARAFTDALPEGTDVRTRRVPRGDRR